MFYYIIRVFFSFGIFITGFAFLIRISINLQGSLIIIFLLGFCIH